MRNRIKNHPIIFAISTFFIILVVCGVIAAYVSTSYSLYLDYGTEDNISQIEVWVDGKKIAEQKEDGQIDVSGSETTGNEDIVKVTDIMVGAHSTRIKFHALHSGQATMTVSFTIPQMDKGDIKRGEVLWVTVNKLHGIFVGRGISNYAGFSVFYYGFAIYSGLMFLFFIWLKKQRTKETYYSYKTITAWTGILCFGAMFLVNLFCSIMIPIWLTRMDVRFMTLLTSNAMMALTLVAMPFMLVFAIAMTHSNISLMINEGKKIRNMYGIFIGILLLIGTVIVIVLFVLNLLKGKDNYIIAILYSVFTACFSIFQYMLAGSIISGISAAYRKIDFGKDYIIILGCAIKKDGTLYPLIRGRVDRAIRFWKEQKEKNGKIAFFIPSGGKGSDEILSEAQAMTNYLLEQGIPEEYIIPETNSKTTLENMKFSKEIIDSRTNGAKVIYSTTNFHVFRSGILAESVGLKAEGIGSRTKWYFWPNALIRELLGIYATRPKLEIAITLGVAILAGISGFLYYLIA